MRYRSGKRRYRAAKYVLWTVVALAAAAVAAGWVAWGRGDGAVTAPMPDFATLELRGTPNQYLVLPPGFQAGAVPHATSPVFDVPADELELLALEVISGQPRVAMVSADRQHRTYAFVQRTRFLRFPDTITVRFVEIDAARSSVAIYSRSKFGRSDLGENRRRVESWLAAIEARLSS